MLGPTSNIHCAALGDDSAAYFAGPLGEFRSGAKRDEDCGVVNANHRGARSLRM